MKMRFLKLTALLFALLFGAGVALSAQELRTIRILTIGNSFSEDAVENYLYELGAAENIDFIIGNAYIGGCSLERHYNNAQQDKADYAYRKIQQGRKTERKQTSLAYCIEDEAWDYVSFQQVSQLSGVYASYFPYLPELMAYVKQHLKNPKATFVLHRTWAYAKDSNHGGFANYNKDQNAMFRSIVKTTHKVACQLKDIAFIVPVGTAIQNARSSSKGDSLCRDGFHLDLKIGRYTAACTWFEKLTGISPVANTAFPQGMSAEDVAIAQEAAHKTVKRPNRVTRIRK